MKTSSDRRTLILVNLASIMESADSSLLPAVYNEVQKALHTDPTGLGSLTLYRSLVQTSFYPLAAYLATHFNRAHVIAAGAFLWSAATFLVAVSSTFSQVAISRAFNGIGLAIVIPAIQSLVADATDDTTRGAAFGWLHLTGTLGSIIGSLCGVLLASTPSFAGIAGWRISFHLVAILSVIVGVLVYLFAKDPRFPKSETETQLELMKEAKSVIKIPTFQIIVCQGVPGSFPSHALSFAILWLELIGFSHVKSALLWTLFVIARAFGGLFGGKMGDLLAQRLPNSGRIIMSQISSSSAIPLAAILLLALPYDPSTAFLHGLAFTIMGFFTAWPAPATNNPIFAEIVPEKSRTCIYALDRSLETILASFAAPLVGILAQKVYGYKPIPKGSPSSNEIKIDRENAASLAKALYTAIGIPAAMCCFIYSFLYCTYPRDRERARMVALVESEMHKLHEQEEGETEERHGINNVFDDLSASDENSLLSR